MKKNQRSRETTTSILRIFLSLADLPWPLNGGKRFRSWAALEALRRIGDVDVVVLTPPGGDMISQPPGIVVRSFTHLQVPSKRAPFALGALLVKRLPWQIAVQRWEDVRLHVSSNFGDEYDVAWFGALEHELCLRSAVRAHRIVVDTDDVQTAKLEGYLKLPAAGVGVNRLDRFQRHVELPFWHRLQAGVASRADAVVVCSELDRERFGGPRTFVVPNAYPDPGGPTRRPYSRPTLLLVANFTYEPNLDAARHAAAHILPAVRDRIPGTTLRLVGRGAHRLGNLAEFQGVRIVGEVEDVRSELSSASVAIAPIRYGGGTRLKVIEALAHQVPQVVTTLACEGLLAEAGVHLEIADDPHHFAAACARLILDPARAASLAESGRVLYERHYQLDSALSAINKVIGAVMTNGLP